ncbi:hypothetical protein SKP52_02370 [Sphingopyxis fribergensis]|uniref:Uncharacterized protein n=1 Tax=Sphingopyxis fribergensis TaxID=1515612 RepID=A0A0A7PBT6_9SPHN|nr:hypothetical protein SKP52_02370 [Sphingopyxis fribergensis]
MILNMTAPRTGFLTQGQNNWQPRTATSWQRERRDGPILPMIQPKPSLFNRIWGGGRG